MRRRTLHRRAAPIGLLTAAVFACTDTGPTPTAVTPPDEPRATIISAPLSNLTPVGTQGISATAITEEGIVAGYASHQHGTTLYQHFARWTAAGGLEVIEPVDGNLHTAAFGINAHGVLAGYRYLSSTGIYVATTWSAATVFGDLETTFYSVADDINDAGQVAGYAFLLHPDVVMRLTAVRWRTGSTREEIGRLLPIGESYPQAINNHGDVAGYWYANGLFLAFAWFPDDGMHALPVPAGMQSCTGWDINDTRQVLVRCNAITAGGTPAGPA